MVENNNAFTPNANPVPTPAAGPAPRADYISPAPGDILLGATPTKKSKKPLIIVFVLISVLIILAIGIVLTIVSSSKTTDSLSGDWDDFVNYANLVLYGDDKTRTIKDTTYSATEDYYIMTAVFQLMNQEDYDAYLDKLIAEGDGFLAEVSGHDELSIAREQFLPRHQLILAYLYACRLGNFLDNILTIQIGGGSINDQFTKNFSGISDSDDARVNEYYRKMQELVQARIEMLRILTSQGCNLSNIQGDENCYAKYTELSTNLSSTESTEVKQLQQDSRRQVEAILPGLWKIAKELNV